MMLRREVAFVAQITGLSAVRTALRNHAVRRAPYRLPAFIKCVDNWHSTDPNVECTGATASCKICPLRKERRT